MRAVIGLLLLALSAGSQAEQIVCVGMGLLSQQDTDFSIHDLRSFKDKSMTKYDLKKLTSTTTVRTDFKLVRKLVHVKDNIYEVLPPVKIKRPGKTIVIFNPNKTRAAFVDFHGFTDMVSMSECM